MANAGEILRKFVSLFRKQRLDGDLDAELASHLDLAAEEHRHKGVPAEEARRQATLRLGGIEQSKEEHRDARGCLRSIAFCRICAMPREHYGAILDSQFSRS